MVDRIDKQLRKLDPKQQSTFTKLIKQILNGDLEELDVVRLKGSNDIFRVRKSSYRLIFQRLEHGEIRMIAFEHRSETTYKSL